MNEVSTATHNALTITQQYPESEYNLLVPVKTVAEIAEIHRPVMSVVFISTNLNDKEVYKMGGDYALTKKGLTKLSKAAGIRILESKSVLPTKCEKCVAVSKGIGRPAQCGSCDNKDVKHQVRISMPLMTGEEAEVIGTKEIIYEDVAEGMSGKQLKEFAKFRSEICESKALNRALRTAMQIKSTYTERELQKPFVVAYLVPNMDNEDVKRAAIDKMFSATQEIYGVSAPGASGRHVIYADDEAETEYEVDVNMQAQEIVEAQEVRAEPEQPHRELPQEKPKHEPRKNEPQEQLDDIPPCESCGNSITEKVYNYSVRKYGIPLCYSCQREYSR